MNFAPFSFLNAQAIGYNPNTPTTISDLTFWLDFNDTSKMALSGIDILSLTSSFQSASVNVEFHLAPLPGSSYYKLYSSLSNPSLKTAYVNSYPTAYREQHWNTSNNDYIVQGPKSDTLSYPDGMTFFVLNREYESQLGYYFERWNGSSDRGAIYSENRPTPGSPQLDMGAYDTGLGASTFQTTGSANQILTRQNSGTQMTLFRGSTQVAQSSTAPNGGNDQQNRTTRQFYNLGRYGDSVSGQTEQTAIKTYFCELIHYNRVLTTDERQTVWNYLSSKWNITL